MLRVILSLILFSVASTDIYAADITLPGIDVNIAPGSDEQEVATAFKVLLALTVLSLAPGFLVVMTSFTRIIIVLSILRHALGMQQTPPNVVLISVALFLTLFTMAPITSQIYEKSAKPFFAGDIGAEQALDEGMDPLREFMIRQTREEDLLLFVDISGQDAPQNMDEIMNSSLIPAFMVSELRTAFQIGFIIFLPFLLIDIVVAGILMSMGMMMVPPMMISMPIKILMFVLIDGWNLLIHSLMASFS